MTTKTLIITPQGTAREINKIEKPIYKTGEGNGYYSKLSYWKSIEDSLKEYKVVYPEDWFMTIGSKGVNEPLIIGKSYKFSVNEEDKTAIIL